MEDAHARRDWGWKPRFDLTTMTEDMLRQLAKQYQVVGRF